MVSSLSSHIAYDKFRPLSGSASMPTVTFVQGGGVGLDQEAAVRQVLRTVGVPLDFDLQPAGRYALEIGKPALPEELFTSIRKHGIALKTKLLPPVGAPTPTAHGPKAPPNTNILFRRELGLFVSTRPIHNIAGLPARFQDVSLHLVREISEDLYATTEHEIVPGVVQSFKVVTEAACMRFFRYTFELAQRLNRGSVHCIHKANILKMADGLFLDCFRKVAADFPSIAPKEMIVDNTCMQLVSKPQQFEVLAAGNLYGDLLSDLGAGLVGGISATAAVNVGPDVKVYEAVYGVGHEVVPPGRANPLPLIMPTVELLKDLGETTAAGRIVQAVESVLGQGRVRPADLGGTAGTSEFTDTLCKAITG